MKCDRCLSIGDMGSCQNFKSERYGEQVSGQDACSKIEVKAKDKEIE